MIQGDYKVHVRGITGQLEKAEMLQNLVQFMNLIGQNPQAWVPYINQSKLLQRILEAFRPAIHDIEEIIADPETAAAQQQAMFGQTITPDLLKLIPDLIRLQHSRQDAEFDRAQVNAEQMLDYAKHQHEREATMIDNALRIGELRLNKQIADQTPQSAGVSSSSTQSGQAN